MFEHPKQYSGGVIKSEEEFAILLIAVPVAVIIIFAIFKYMEEKKQKRMKLEAQSSEPSDDYVNVCRVTIESMNNQTTNLTPSTPQPAPSDHQIIFGTRYESSEPIIHFLWNTDVPATAVIQQMEEQRRLDDFQNDFERRAQERRDTSDRNLVIPPFMVDLSFHNDRTEFIEIFASASPETPENYIVHSYPAPRYVSQDDSLPSYEQAVG